MSCSGSFVWRRFQAPRRRRTPNRALATPNRARRTPYRWLARRSRRLGPQLVWTPRRRL
uniref:Uncharacterized protein n=1 Tax=Arundo donax TaxID=35708 RepID=A0A0A8ZII4_ARUDO